MKLGTFMMPLHPPSREPWQTYAEDREAIILADRLGYAEALVGELLGAPRFEHEELEERTRIPGVAVGMSWTPTGGEILFIDYWNSLSGLGQFFADPQVQEGASRLFAERDGVVWAPTSGFGSAKYPG